MGSRTFRGGLAAIAVSLSVALAGCGAAGPAAPSNLDPAQIAPAGSLIYATLTVRPQGVERTQVRAAMHKLFGSHADASIRAAMNRLFRRAGTTYTGAAQKWLGQRVALVVTGLGQGAGSSMGAIPQGDTALIVPTGDTADARRFLERDLRRHPAAAGGIVGHYAVFGGPAAFRAIQAVAAGGASLASRPAYRSAIAAVPADAVATGYMNLHGYLEAFSQTALGGTIRGLLHHQLGNLTNGATAVMWARVTARAISLDYETAGVQHSYSATVPGELSGLPASSWLAMGLGGRAFTLGLRGMDAAARLGMAHALEQAQSVSPLLAAAVARRLSLVENDVLPALGPFSLSVGGTSPLDLTAGLQLKPASLAAANRLLGMLRALAARSPVLQISGSATDFTVRLPTGGRLSVTESGGTIVLTYGFADVQAFLHPSSTLAGTPLFRQALAELPAGSSPSVFVSFAPIASLVQLLDHGAQAAKAVDVLHKLSYSAIGGSGGHQRLVLGLN